VKDFEGSFLEVNRDLASVEASLREVEVVVWDIRDIPGNMLITHSQGVEAAVESGSKVRVTHMLNQVVRTLDNKYCNSGKSVAAKHYEYLDKSLVAANKFDPDGVLKVRAKLAELIVEEPEEA
jgi:hypothetical protein